MRAAQQPVKKARWNTVRRIISIIIFLVIKFKSIFVRQRRFVIKLLAVLMISYQYIYHRRYWSGFWDSWRVIVQYRRPWKFQKQIYTASDSEEYAVWTQKHTKKRKIITPTNHKEHIWICLPAGMERVDVAFSALIAKQAFKGSKVCMFNNPGISTEMQSDNPLPSPTETKYVIEYIERIQREQGLRVSLIGFSIGCVQALRVLHQIQNDPQNRDRIKLESVVLVHGPDIVRDAIQHFKVYSI